MKLTRADVPAFLDALRLRYYGGREAATAVDCATRCFAAVGLLPLPRRTMRRRPVGVPGGPFLYGPAPAPAVTWAPEIVRDPAVPATVELVEVEVEERGGPAWDRLTVRAPDGAEASCRLGATFAHPLGSFACAGAGVGS